MSVEKNIKILPMKYPPPILSYPAHGDLLSVVLNHEEAYDWFYNYYIQLETPVISPAGIRLDFYTILMYKTCPFVYYQRLSRELIAKRYPTITEFIIENIDLGNYVYFCIDRYFISAYARYQQMHDLHDIFCYGYNLEEKVFYVADCFKDGLYSYSKAPFAEVDEGYLKYGETGIGDWMDGVETIRYRNKYGYVFQPELVVQFLTDYLLAKNTSLRYHINSERFCDTISRNNFLYGMDVYKHMLNYMNFVMADVMPFERIIDRRPLKVIWEHKKVMLARIKYLEKNKYLGGADEIYKMYLEIEELTKLIFNNWLKSSVSLNKKLIPYIIGKIEDVQRKEEKALKCMINRIII
jgi:hypothetical protein